MGSAKQHDNDLFEYLLRLGDDRLILGHRLSEWCGHGPMLEEDIALSNIALDNVGQAISLLQLAGEIEGKGRSEDDLAYFRETIDYRNLMLLEQPNGDFAHTLVRQFFFDVYSYYTYLALEKSLHEGLGAIAVKSLREATYHLRHSREWILRLGDGTEESHRRTQVAVNHLWPFTGEMFEADEIDERLTAQGIAADLKKIQLDWRKVVNETLAEATLEKPEDRFLPGGSRQGKHTEHLGFILSEMQILPRSYPDAGW